ncbi:MAG TPA: UDP-3-O-acyl-N-acetylglucosamine deacetylase, partial [Thermoanaerobaculia bacterium]|nr:UDP-3-O-acyl-N-acetylglucosamine deacetylase [Thermoanaerobaculia bacterium]
RGRGRGGDLDNCVIFGAEGPNNALRFPDEPVRHKALDAVGDLALAGGPLWAFVEVERGGHHLHFAILEALRERPDCWVWMQGHPRPQETVVERPSLRMAAARG